MISFFLL